MKRIHSAVIGALAMTFAGAGVAAGTSGAMGSDSGIMGGSASIQAPDLSSSHKSTDLIGMNVANRKNENLGSISNLIVGKDGKVSHVVLDYTTGETTAANKYIVPWDRVQFTPGQSVAMLDVDSASLSSEFAAFDESMTAPVSGSTQPAPGSSMSTPPPSDSTSGGGY